MTKPKLKVVATPKLTADTVLVLAVESEGKKIKPVRTAFSSTLFANATFEADFAPVGASSQAESLTKVQLSSADGTQVLTALVGTTTKVNPFASFSGGLREIGGAISRKLSTSESIVVDLGIETESELLEFIEGLLLGAYDPKTFKSKTSSYALKNITVVSSAKVSKASLARAEILATGVHATRDLTNLPANHLHPADLAKCWQSRARARR